MPQDVSSTIDRLERELAELKAEVTSQPPDTTSRRGMLKAVAAGAAGAAAAGVAGLVTASPAGADDPNDLTLGESKGVGDFTHGYYLGAASGAAFLFQSGSVYDPGDASYPCALAGWATTAAAPHGVYAFTQVPNGYGVVSVGGVNGANLLVFPAGVPGPDRTGTHALGELLADISGDLWLCVEGGTPGTWRKLAGLATAGAFHAISPRRVYDSRSGAGKLDGGDERTISVATSGADEVVPAGATAVAITATVTNTEGSAGGYVSVRPAGTPWAGTSSVNWFGPGQNIATTVISALGGDRELRLRGGESPTDVVVDVTGYYR